MTTKFWWKEANIYELYVDKFAGDFKGLEARLDYFVMLGVNCLHILPHYPSPMVDDGYDVTDYRGVRPELGTLEDMKSCIDAARVRGVRIILDFVLNHVSTQHPWFVEAQGSRNNPKRNFFLWSDTGHEFPFATNAFPNFKPSNWVPNPQTGDYYFSTFYPEQADLNWDNLEVVDAMIANMDFWADMGVSGFRLDAAPYLIKREGTTSRGLPETHQVLKKMRAHLDEKYPGVILLAEAHLAVSETKTYFGNGDECQMAYNFSLMESLWLTLQYDDRSYVDAMTKETSGIPENCVWAVFLRNHDEISLATLSPELRDRLVSFLDPNHEYPFNNGLFTSMRVASALKDDKKIREAFELLYSLPGAPVMYYGDEIGMKNLPPLAQANTLAMSDGGAFVSAPDTRKCLRAPFDWGEAEKEISDPLSLFNEVASLIKQRTGVLPAGEVLPVLTQDAQREVVENVS